jgi:regulator of replication initiation timing
MNLVNEISSLQTELESLRAENKIVRERNIVLEFENDQLKRRLISTEAARDSHMSGKVRLKTLLDQAGQHLVSGIQRYHDETRAEQYDVLAEAEPAPKFLTNNREPEVTHD